MNNLEHIFAIHWGCSSVG